LPAVETGRMDAGEFAGIRFQKGPIREAGVNGCQMEDLLAIVVDRLDGFQAGSFACPENELARGYVKQALCCLNHRTQERCRQGIEGTNQRRHFRPYSADDYDGCTS
jgi:hypothetical protein